MGKIDIADRIKGGNQKRQEEQRRFNQIKKEYDEYISEKNSRSSRGSVAYIPNILVALFFVSLPLSERIIDWKLVGIFLAINALWSLVVPDPSHWLNIISIGLVNFGVVRVSSSTLGDLPARIASIPLTTVGVFAAFNMAVALTVYLTYMKRWVLFSPDAPVCFDGLAKNKAEADALCRFVMERRAAERLDIAACIVVISNLAMLVYTDVLSPDATLLAVRNLLHVLG